ncbi:helix-turn-helix domain-containing protein [Cellulomonas denverensis]|nr:helix-turn-helix domain-containing protein [Cellulomonas denverensis]GIG27297.1 hypothetical protein Cde04nite_35410 [Cellulomonas denverensis]
MLYAIDMPLAQSILRELSSRGPLLRAEIADGLGVSASSLRLHLEQLENAGIIQADVPAGQRRGRSVRYSVRVKGVVDAVDTLLAFVLTTNEYRVARHHDPRGDARGSDN